ncbi:MAG: hypothetical protein RBR71_14235 [Gudongella sp.]|nr:hypothetical protein [Gudongella sp.]
MPKLVSLTDVINEIYAWGKVGESVEFEQPMSLEVFKRIMLGSELVVTDKTIRNKYDQIVAAGLAREAQNRKNMIFLNMIKIRDYLIDNHKIIDNRGAHTDTHTSCDADNSGGSSAYLGAHTDTHTSCEVGE